MKFVALRMALLRDDTTVRLGDYPPTDNIEEVARAHPWNSCKLATTLVLLMAAKNTPASIRDAHTFMSRALGGLPTMADVNASPSANLAEEFRRYKRLALDSGVVTIIGVNLVDVEMLERGEQRHPSISYSSFSHSFVIGVDAQGWRLFQSWGRHGYRLDEYLDRGGARVRSWKQGKKFLRAFGRLTSTNRTAWTDEINAAYLECFEVDVRDICQVKRLQRPIVPVYRSWVRLLVINDVTMEDVQKFVWQQRPSEL